MTRRVRLGELLLRAGVVSELQLKAALDHQKKWGGRLGKILVDMNFISEDLLVKALARLLALPRANLSDIQVPQQILDRFDPNDCQARGYLPVAYDARQKRVTVALADPNDVALVDELRFKLGLRVDTAIAGERELQEAVRSLFFGESFDTSVTGEEPGLKLVDNRGVTLIKHRREIFGDEEEPVPPAQPTGVERASEPPAQPTGVERSSGPPPGGGAQETLAQLVEAQRRQAAAVRALLDLFVEKGLFTREEFVAQVNSRAG